MRPKSPSVTPVVVLHLDNTTGLQAARTFGTLGVPVIGIADNPHHFCCRTKHVKRVIQAEIEEPGLTTVLLRLAQEIDGKAVLWPCSDAAVLAVSRDRAALAAHYLFDLPPHDTVLDVMQKARFYRRALESELPIPRTTFIDTPHDVETACETLCFPCALKPSTRTAAWKAKTGVKAYKVEDAAALRRLIAELGSCDTPLIVQDWIEGGDGELFSCYAYVNEDQELLAAATCRKIRQWPPDTGAGCSNRICEAPELVETTRRVCRQMHCWGLVFIQFKQDPRDGRPVIIEPHVGRPGVGLFVAEAAGAEMHRTVYCDLLGQALPGNRRPIRDDAVWVHVFNDIRSALALRRRGELTLGSWLRSLRGHRRTAVFSWTDPLPFILEITRSTRRFMHRRDSRKIRRFATEN